ETSMDRTPAPRSSLARRLRLALATMLGNGRLRHRPVVAERPQPAAAGHPEDRPDFRGEARPGPRRPGSGVRHHLAGDSARRAGDRRGNRDASTALQSADSVRDLHELLAAAGVPWPYLLVGVSFGGLLAIMYAATSPDQVMGLVSLDGSLPTDDQVDQLIPKDEREQVMGSRMPTRGRGAFTTPPTHP